MWAVAIFEDDRTFLAQVYTLCVVFSSPGVYAWEKEEKNHVFSHFPPMAP